MAQSAEDEVRRLQESKELVIKAMGTLSDDAMADPLRSNFILTERALRMRAQTDERSIVMRTLTAIPIAARITNIELEESSTRLKITFIADSQKNGESVEEQIRSDRTDGPLGNHIMDMWNAAQGHHVRIYKRNEPVSKASNSSGQTVRIAPYVQIIG